MKLTPRRPRARTVMAVATHREICGADLEIVREIADLEIVREIADRIL
jgi:hypothetical protein